MMKRSNPRIYKLEVIENINKKHRNLCNEFIAEKAPNSVNNIFKYKFRIPTDKTRKNYFTLRAEMPGAQST